MIVHRRAGDDTRPATAGQRVVVLAVPPSLTTARSAALVITEDEGARESEGSGSGSGSDESESESEGEDGGESESEDDSGEQLEPRGLLALVVVLAVPPSS